MATNENDYKPLQELGGSDYEMADGQEDIRGWDVKNSAGQKFGEVDELIFDEQSRKIKYLVLDLDDDEMNIEDDRKVLIPIGLAELHEDDDDVILHNITTEQIISLPAYDKENLDALSEPQLLSVFGTERLGMQEGDYYNDENLYRNRLKNQPGATPGINENFEGTDQERKACGIRIRSRIIETPLEDNINLREDQVNPMSDKTDEKYPGSDTDHRKL